MTTLDENTLIAYVDGELDGQTAREVEALLSEDENAQRFVDRQREIVALARIAFNDTLHEEVPDHLVQMVHAHEEHRDTATNIVAMAQPRAKSTKSDWRFALPLAAAVAGLMIGGGGGFSISEQRTQQKVELAAISFKQDQASMDATLNRALEINLSGTSLSWDSPQSGRKVQFTPVRTYQDKTGRFCREYKQEVVMDGETVDTFGLACRNTEGRWQTRYLIFDNAERSL